MKRIFAFIASIFVCILIVSFIPFVSASPATFGNDSFEDPPSIFFSTYDKMWASKYTASTSGQVTKITVWNKALNDDMIVKCAIYTDSAGYPDSLVGYTEQLVTAQDWSGWKDYNIVSGGAITGSTIYWLTVWIDIGGASCFLDYTGTEEDGFTGGAQVDFNGFPSTFPAEAGFNDGNISIYATYNEYPTTPTNWTNLGMNLTDHTPSISWTKGTDPDGDTVTTYVYVGTTPVPTTVETSTTGETANLGSTVSLSDGVTYYYRLRSWDGYQYSGYTTSDQFRMNSKPSNPTSWTNLGMNVTDHTPTVIWSGQSDSESDTITVYVYVGATSTPTTLEGYSTSGTLDLGSTVPLNDGVTYYYRLRAHDGYEWNDSCTTSDQFRMNTPPTTPTSPTNLSLREIDHTPDVSWTDSTDAESDSITYHVQTSINGTNFYLDWSGADNSCTLDLYTFADGNDYWWRVRAHDGYEYSGWAPSSAGDEFQFNQIPTVSPAVTPVSPITTDDLTCAPNGYDPDGDDMTYTYQWYENDVLMSGETSSVLDDANTAVDNVYLCEVIPHDGYEYGSAENSNEVLIGNATPTKPTNWTNLGMNLIDNTPTITWTEGTDADSDPVTTYIYVGTTSTPTTVENSTTGETTDLGSVVTLEDGVTYYYRLRSWDGKVFSGYTTADEFRINTPPSVPTGINNLGMNLIDHTPDKTFTKGTDAEGDTVYTIAYLDNVSSPTEEDKRGTGTSLTLGENASHSTYPLTDGITYHVRLRSWDGYEYSAYTSNDEFRMNTSPTIPTSFTDLAENLYEHFPSIVWIKGTDNEGDTVFTYIYVGITSTPTTEEGHITGTTTNLGTTIPLNDNTTYYYRLRSWDGYEWSSYTTADKFSMAPLVFDPAPVILGLLVCMTFAFSYLYYKIARVRDLVSGGEAIKGVFIFILAMIIMWAIAYGIISAL